MAHLVKYLPAMLEIQVQSLGQEDPLEKGMATHSSTLAWKISWTEEPEQQQRPSTDETEQINIKLSIYTHYT